jgi:hypothetical protein
VAASPPAPLVAPVPPLPVAVEPPLPAPLLAPPVPVDPAVASASALSLPLLPQLAANVAKPARATHAARDVEAEVMRERQPNTGRRERPSATAGRRQPSSRQSRAALRRKSLARVPTLGVIDARSTGMHGRVRDGRYLRDFS